MSSSSYYFYGQTGPAITGSTGAFTGNVTVGGTLGVTGVSSFAAGTAGAPGIGVGGATDGLFRVSAGIMGLTGTGVEVARFSATVAQVPLAAGIKWNGSTQLFGATNKQLRISNTGDTSPTTGVSGIVIGTTSVGSSLVYDSTYGLRSMSFNQGANGSFVGVNFAVSNVGNVNVGVNPGAGGETGLGFPTTTSLALRTNALLAFGIDTNQNTMFYGTGGSTGTNAASTVNLKSVSANTTLNLAGVATTIIQIPAGAIVMAVTARVTTAITAAVSTSWTLTAGGVTYATAKAFALGTTVNSTDYQASFVGPTFYATATNLVVTLNSDTATAGVVRAVVFYFDTTAPTS